MPMTTAISYATPAPESGVNTGHYRGYAIFEVMMIGQSKEWQGRIGRISNPKTTLDPSRKFRERQSMVKNLQSPLSAEPMDRSRKSTTR